MKRPLFFLLLFFVIQEAFYFTVFRPQKNREPLGEATQEAVRLLDNCDLIPISRKFIASDFVRRVGHIDWPIFLATSARQAVELIHQQHQPPIDALDLVPKNAMLMLEITDAATAVDNFFTSQFGKTLTSINWYKVLRRLEIKRRFRRPLEKNISGLMKMLKKPLVKQVLSKRVVLAQLPPSLFQGKKSQTLLDNLLVLIHAGPDNNGSLLADLLDLIQGRHGKKTTFRYYGVNVNSLTLAHKKKLYVASVGQHILLSFSQKPMRQSIDLFIHRFSQKQTGLSLNNDCEWMKDHGFSDNDFFLYADLFQLKFYFKLLSGLSAEKRKGEAPDARPWTAGTRSMGLFHRTEKNIDQFRTVVHFSDNQLQPFQQRIYTRKPIHNSNLKDMPDSLLIYFWCNWLEPSFWWRITVSQGEEDELASAGRISTWIEEQTGMDMEDLLALFGREFSFNVTEISTAGFFPVPRICFIIEVSQPEKVGSFFEKIIAGMPVRRDKVAGVPVVSLMAANGMLQPSYAFIEGRLLLADSREQIEDIILNRNKPLIEDKTFQAVNMGMKKPANLNLFARTAELVNSMKELVSWAGTMIAVRDHKIGAKSKILVDQILLPLLDGFTMYQAVGIRSYTDYHKLTVDTTVLRTESNDEVSQPNSVKK
jgi:hypothetical protein